MTFQECKNLFDTKTLKMGRYYTMVYSSTENGYTKTTTTKVRFVNYYNIKSVKAAGKVPNPQATPNPSIQVIIPHVLTYNSNTQNYLLQCATTPNGKAKSVYQDPNGNEIDKATYEMAVPPKKHGKVEEIFRKKLQDIISIG